jgi:predicted hydrolase (HD superfamily)
MIPNKKQAIEILEENIKEKANLDHCFLVGYGMQGLAKHFKEDSLTKSIGLLLDYYMIWIWKNIMGISKNTL